MPNSHFSVVTICSTPSWIHCKLISWQCPAAFPPPPTKTFLTTNFRALFSSKITLYALVPISGRDLRLRRLVGVVNKHLPRIIVSDIEGEQRPLLVIPRADSRLRQTRATQYPPQGRGREADVCGPCAPIKILSRRRSPRRVSPLYRELSDRSVEE